MRFTLFWGTVLILCMATALLSDYRFSGNYGKVLRMPFLAGYTHETHHDEEMTSALGNLVYDGDLDSTRLKKNAIRISGRRQNESICRNTP